MMYWIENPEFRVDYFFRFIALRIDPAARKHSEDLQDNALIDSTENITSNFDLVKVYCILNESHNSQVTIFSLLKRETVRSWETVGLFPKRTQKLDH